MRKQDRAAAVDASKNSSPAAARIIAENLIAGDRGGRKVPVLEDHQPSADRPFSVIGVVESKPTVGNLDSLPFCVRTSDEHRPPAATEGLRSAGIVGRVEVEEGSSHHDALRRRGKQASSVSRRLVVDKGAVDHPDVTRSRNHGRPAGDGRSARFRRLGVADFASGDCDVS